MMSAVHGGHRIEKPRIDELQPGLNSSARMTIAISRRSGT